MNTAQSVIALDNKIQAIIQRKIVALGAVIIHGDVVSGITAEQATTAQREAIQEVTAVVPTKRSTTLSPVIAMPYGTTTIQEVITPIDVINQEILATARAAYSKHIDICHITHPYMWDQCTPEYRQLWIEIATIEHVPF